MKRMNFQIVKHKLINCRQDLDKGMIQFPYKANTVALEMI